MKFRSHNKNNKLPSQNQLKAIYNIITIWVSSLLFSFPSSLTSLPLVWIVTYIWVCTWQKWCNKVYCNVVGCGTFYVVGRGSNYSLLFIRSRIGHSAQRPCRGLDSQYSDRVVGWTVSTATELWAGCQSTSDFVYDIGKNSSLVHSIHTDSGTHLNFCSFCSGVPMNEVEGVCI